MDRPCEWNGLEFVAFAPLDSVLSIGAAEPQSFSNYTIRGRGLVRILFGDKRMQVCQFGNTAAT